MISITEGAAKDEVWSVVGIKPSTYHWEGVLSEEDQKIEILKFDRKI